MGCKERAVGAPWGPYLLEDFPDVVVFNRSPACNTGVSHMSRNGGN